VSPVNVPATVLFLLFVVAVFIVLPIVIVWREEHWRKKMDEVLTELELLCDNMEEDLVAVHSHTDSASFATRHYNEFTKVIEERRRKHDL
jgi:hypothetical protein